MMSSLLAEIDWNLLLQKPDVLPLLVTCGVAGLLGMTAIIAVQWRKTQEARLKEKMIDRGYSADEILRVIIARPGKKAPTESCRTPECSTP